ncbi:MAG: UDP-4-amino-4,6-dideoxy-N-acetyl-beta-L-altrosamine transaminase [Cycloclasticus sp.]
MIPYGKQEINQQDLDAVLEVLNSDFLTQGPKVPAFERAVAQYTGAKHSVAVNSATSALHIACLALGVESEDVVWTTPITFVASANCALYCGGTVDFVDVDSATNNMSPVALKKKLEQVKSSGQKLPKVIIPVHLTGLPCDMAVIHKLSLEYGFKIIEDASHAIGGRYLNKAVGACEYSDITVFSFHPVKIITTAEGGLATTNDSDLAEKMGLYRSHGVTRDSHLMEGDPDGAWYYEQVALGYNYRMTELQGALGLSQMTRLDQFVAARHSLAKRYLELLDGLPIKLPCYSESSYSGLHLFVIRLDLSKLKLSRKEVFDQLRQSGIGVNVHYIPVHTQPYYKNMGFKHGDFPLAESYYSEAISLPMFHLMTHEQQDKVVAVLKEILG